MTKVMFVCLGNICRSPMAEAILNHKCSIRNIALYAESSGTAAYHIGEAPDPRTINICLSKGVAISHQAQQLTSKHLEEFDYILVMDQSNYDNAVRLAPEFESKVELIRNYDDTGTGDDVIDPWYGTEDGFETCYEVLDRSINSFLEKHF